MDEGFEFELNAVTAPSEAFEMRLNAAFEPTEAFDMELSVPSTDITFRFYLNVPEPVRVGGFMLDVPSA